MLVKGDIVKLKSPMLGNQIEAIGVVFEEYDIGGVHGLSVIFPNGEYDGFCEGEQRTFLKKIGHNYNLSCYRFTNVMQLTRDFDAGFFTHGFREQKGGDNVY